ncbi:MAG: biopolymer transporter ExbD, partial [Gemmatimonadota bacterium]
ALNAQEAPFFVTIMSDGRIFMEETEVTLSELSESLPQLLAAGDIERVYIRGDSLANYGPVLRTISIVKNAGVPVNLVAQPWRGDL